MFAYRVSASYGVSWSERTAEVEMFDVDVNEPWRFRQRGD
jgi:hypothetical protein